MEGFMGNLWNREIEAAKCYCVVLRRRDAPASGADGARGAEGKGR